ncbi:MAG: flagellar filament capping protein FliD [Rubrivivax sp.]|nr:flagellar filament capping protein FliD [Rubrivivax sp.]
MSTYIAGVGSINSAGIGSGLDVNSIITQLMAVEQRPLVQLQTQASDIKAQVSTFGQLQSYFSALQDKSEALTDATLWGATTASSADASAVSVSSGTDAATGSYAVSVARLASMQTVTAAALASSTSTLNEGALTIELGTWTGTPTSGFTAKTGSTPITVNIGAGETSLAAIRDKINAAGAGVTASIVNDASGARLSLRSSATGAENAFRITAAETVNDGVAGTGLSALAYDAAGGSSQMTRSETAVDAQATINGIAITSASNTLTNVVDGLTISLLKPTASAVSVTVAADTAGIKQKITDFIAAFNGAANFLRTQTAYNPDAKTGGALQGDQTAISLQRALRNVLNQASTASSAFSRLSDVGITMQADGTLAADATKLDAALGNLPELEKLLATQGADSASSGFMQRWENLADAALGTGGTFATRTESLNSRLSRNTKDQDSMQMRLGSIESRMRAQYTALDTKMAELNGLSAYMTQQFEQFNLSNDN